MTGEARLTLGTKQFHDSICGTGIALVWFRA